MNLTSDDIGKTVALRGADRHDPFLKGELIAYRAEPSVCVRYIDGAGVIQEKWWSAQLAEAVESPEPLPHIQAICPMCPWLGEPTITRDRHRLAQDDLKEHVLAQHGGELRLR